MTYAEHEGRDLRLLRRLLPQLEKRYPVGAASRRKGFVFDSEVLIEAGRHGYRLMSVRIPAIYSTERASHFRPVADFTQIGIMVARQLISRGLDPLGLVRSLRAAPASTPSPTVNSREMGARV
jgi:hypothetical protein